MKTNDTAEKNDTHFTLDDEIMSGCCCLLVHKLCNFYNLFGTLLHTKWVSLCIICFVSLHLA